MGIEPATTISRGAHSTHCATAFKNILYSTRTASKTVAPTAVMAVEDGLVACATQVRLPSDKKYKVSPFGVSTK